MLSNHNILLALEVFVRWVKESLFEERSRNAENKYWLLNRKLERLKRDLQFITVTHARFWRHCADIEQVQRLTVYTASRMNVVMQWMTELQSTIAEAWTEREQYRQILEAQYCVGEVHDVLLSQLQQK